MQLYSRANEKVVFSYKRIKRKISYWRYMSKKHIHTLTPGLVNTLKKFGDAVNRKGNKIHIRNDLILDISENNNFQKLKYWGLVAKYKVDGNHLAGYWVLTRLGGGFLRNEALVSKKVETEDNCKTGESHEKVKINDFFGIKEEYWQQQFPAVNYDQGSLL